MLKLNHLTGFGSGAAAAAGTPTSYVLDGTGDYLQIPDHADFDFTTGGDFTVELFLRSPDGSAPATEYTLYSHRSDGNDDDLSIVASTGVIEWRINEGGVEVQIFSSGAVLTDNTWHHVALCRDVNDYFIYVDGTDVTSSGSPDSYDRGTGIAGDITIGARNDPAEYFNGHIDEFRISDTCRYPDGTTFTPTITQFVSDANTKLLIHGGEAYTGALTGETTQSCVTFDGTGDYLSIPNHADFQFGTGDFSIEFFVKFDSLSGEQQFYYDAGTQGITVGKNSASSTLNVGVAAVATKTYAWSPVINTWYWVQVIGDAGSTISAYVDGSQIGITETHSYNTTSTGTRWLGTESGSGGYLNGQLAEVRVSDTARGTTVPTEKLVSDGNTLLLIHGDEAKIGTTGSGATFTDSGNTGHTVTEVGNAIAANGGTFNDSGNTTHVVTEVGNARRAGDEPLSGETGDQYWYDFNGTNAHLQVPDHANWSFGTSAWTIEFWYKGNIAAGGGDRLFSKWDTSDKSWSIHFNGTDGSIAFSTSADGTTGDVSMEDPIQGIIDNSWHHVAVTHGTDHDYRIWIDGEQDGATVNDTSGVFNSADDIMIMAERSTTPRNWEAGSMTDIRISDSERYTTSFTPSTTRLVDDGNTLLLINSNETVGGGTFTDSSGVHTVTVTNATQESGKFYKF
jgi:hypothetical protein